MTLNGVMALILRYFTEFMYDVVVKKFTFAISSPDEFLVLICDILCVLHLHATKHVAKDIVTKRAIHRTSNILLCCDSEGERVVNDAWCLVSSTSRLPSNVMQPLPGV